MTRKHAITPTASKPAARPDWRRTNPGYQYSPPEAGIEDGKAVIWLDGGNLADMAFAGLGPQPMKQPTDG